MSWAVFKSEVLALSGDPHVTEKKFADTVANAYASCVSRHIETMSGGGTLLIPPTNTQALASSILQRIHQNLQGHREVNIIQQFGPYIQQYWIGAQYAGPAGTGVVTYTGTWSAPPLPVNLDFRVFVEGFTVAAMVHIMSLVGIHTMFTPPGATVPWSGVTLVTV